MGRMIEKLDRIARVASSALIVFAIAYFGAHVALAYYLGRLG